MQPNAIRQILLSIFFTFVTAISFAQTLKYHRIEAAITPNLFHKLMASGLEIDHFEYRNNLLKAEVSDNDIKLLEQNHIRINYIIRDIENNLAAYNAEIDKQAAAQPPSNLITVPTPVHFGAGGSYGTAGGVAKHFTYEEMQNELDEMRALYPNLITVKTSLGTTDQGRPVFMVRLSDNADTDENEPEVYLNAVHHAREPISMTQLIFFMWHLLENYDTDKEIQTLVNSTEMYIVPCVNPDGYVYNYTQNSSGGSMWRKNRHLNADNTYGVDNNRNYGYNWGGSGSSTSTSSETYRGAAPFSENENITLRNFCNSRQFVTQFNFHSYSNLLIYPYSYITPNNNPEVPVFNQLSSFLTEDNNFPYGNCYAMLGYLASGCAEDWGYGEQTTKGKIYGFTPEIGSASDGFYPAASRIIPLCNSTIIMNKNLLKVSTKYGLVTTNAAATLTGLSGTVPFSLKNFSLVPASYTVALTALSAYVINVDAPKVISSSTMFQTQNDVFNFTIDPATPYGNSLSFEVSTNNGYHIRKDTITIQYTCTAPGSTLTAGITTNSANLSWGSVAGAVDYYVSIKLVSSSVWGADVPVVAGTATSLTGLTPNTAYNWRVRASDCSNYSAIQSFSTLAACTVPVPVTSTVTTNSFTITWPAIASATSYTVQARLQGASTWTSSTVTTTSKLVNGLLPGNTYEYQVSATCPSGNSGFSAIQTVTTPNVIYCTSNGSNNSKEWIDYIQLGAISRTSAAEPGGYVHTGLTTNLLRGVTYSITFSAGFSASVIKENWKMFIDYNADGDFNDGSETIVNTSKTGAGNFTATFTVPANSQLSGTVLRIKMSPKAISNACGTFNNGEVEDYNITIINAEDENNLITVTKNADNANKVEPEVLQENNAHVLQNPFSNKIDVFMEPGDELRCNISLMDMTGRIIYSQQIGKMVTHHQINTTALQGGVYLLIIQNGKNRKTFKMVK
jgi:hypothetical protein